MHLHCCSHGFAVYGGFVMGGLIGVHSRRRAFLLLRQSPCVGLAWQWAGEECVAWWPAAVAWEAIGRRDVRAHCCAVQTWHAEVALWSCCNRQLTWQY